MLLHASLILICHAEVHGAFPASSRLVQTQLVAAGNSMLSVHAGGGEGDGGAEGQGHEPVNKAAECGLAAVVPVR